MKWAGAVGTVLAIVSLVNTELVQTRETRWPVWEEGSSEVGVAWKRDPDGPYPARDESKACDFNGLWVQSWADPNKNVPAKDNMTVIQTGQGFTVLCDSAANHCTEKWEVADGLLSDSWNSSWDKSVTITYPPSAGSKTPTSVVGTATSEEFCFKLRVTWEDGTVWCRGFPLGSMACGGQGAPGPPSPPPAPPPGPQMHIDLHIIEHTHDDTGWVATIPQYYTAQVRNIITTATAGLAQDPARKFSYVEIAYFQLWWREQNSTWREKVRTLVENQQLEWVNAGWCMSDEATSHFVDQVDQMTIGHLYLQAQFGRKTVVPTTGWAIDPFGHTTATPFLFAKMGFNYFQFGRSPDGASNALASAPNGNQFVWRPMASIRDNSVQDIFTYYHKGYTGGPPMSCLSDLGCQDEDMKAYAFAKHAELADRTICPVTLDMYGMDFAVPNFPAADRVVSYFAEHPELNVTATYSTPSQFYKQMHECGAPWEVFSPPNNDFFPYWTGFFTSQPVFKRMVRVASALFHAARVLHTLHSMDNLTAPASLHSAQQLNVLWQAVAVVQHHDAVTGTSKPFNYVDYRQRLKYGSDLAVAVMRDMLGGYTPCLEAPRCANTENTTSTAQPHCIESEGPLCLPPTNSSIHIQLINSLGWARDEVVRLRIPYSIGESGITAVDDDTDAPVLLQAERVVGSNGRNETLVWFAASVQALATSMYTLRIGDKEVTAVQDDKRRPNLQTTLENGQLELTFDESGQLVFVRNKMSGISMSVSLGVRYYTPGDQMDGTYDFHTNDGLCRAFPGDTRTARFSVTRGKVFDEVTRHVDTASHVVLQVRLYHNRTDGVEVVLKVGSVSVRDSDGKDVILQWNTSLETDNVFYSDGSGMELMERRLGTGTFDQSIDPTMPGLNYYPTTVLASIKASDAQLVWISDRSLGCASMRNGSLEKMVFRRLLEGDQKGMNVPLNNTDTMISTHAFLFDTPAAATSAMRPLAWRKYHPLLPAVKSTAGDEVLSARPARAFDGTVMPKNLLLQTLQVLANDWDSVEAPYDIPAPNNTINTPVPTADPTALGDGTVIVRIHHIYAVGEGSSSDQLPGTVDLGALFSGRKITTARELSLSGAQDLANMTRLDWRTGSSNSTRTYSSANACQIDRHSSGHHVMVYPMDICTFAVRLA